MPTVRELVTKIGFDIESSALAKADRDLQIFQNRIKNATRGLDNLANGMIKIGRGLTTFVTLPIAAAGAFSLKAASDVEQLNVAFTTLLDSEEKAKQLTKDLIDFAARTPFTIPGIQRNAKQLLAMGIEADKILPTLKSLGDVAAGVGADLSRVARNFGQVRTQGRLTRRDLNDFAIQGIPLVGALAKQFGVTEKAIFDMVSEGKIGFKEVEQAFINMSSKGGKFFNLMEKQSQTLGGLFSNFVDNLFKGAAAIGEVTVEALNLKAVFRALNSFLEKAVNTFVKMPRPLQIIFLAIVGLTAALGPFLLILGGVLKLFLSLSIAASLLNIALLPLIFKFALIAAALAAISALFAAVFNDVDSWVKGNNSLIGILLGDYEDFVNDLKTLWSDFTQFLDDIVNLRWRKIFDGFRLFLKTIQILIKDVIDDWKTILGLGRNQTSPSAIAGNTDNQENLLTRLKNLYVRADEGAGRILRFGRSRENVTVRNTINNTFQGSVTNEDIERVENASSNGASIGTLDAINSLGMDSIVTESVVQ